MRPKLAALKVAALAVLAGVNAGCSSLPLTGDWYMQPSPESDVSNSDPKLQIFIPIVNTSGKELRIKKVTVFPCRRGAHKSRPCLEPIHTDFFDGPDYRLWHQEQVLILTMQAIVKDQYCYVPMEVEVSTVEDEKPLLVRIDSGLPTLLPDPWISKCGIKPPDDPSAAGNGTIQKSSPRI